MKKKFQDQVYKSLEITEEEKEALRTYKGIFYEVINNMLEPGIENEIAFNNTTGVYKLDASVIRRAITIIERMYAALYKNAIEQSGVSFYSRVTTVYRGTTMEDVERLRKNGQAFRFTSTTYDQNMAKGYFSLNWENPASMRIHLSPDVPYIVLGKVLEEYGETWEKEILLAPFLKASEVQALRGMTSEYAFDFDKQELPEISEKEETELEKYLIETADEQQERITKILKIESELDHLSLKQESLRSYLRMLQSDYAEYKKSAKEQLSSDNIEVINQANKQLNRKLDDIKAVMSDIDKIQKEIEGLIKDKKVLIDQINAWKDKMRILCMSRCRKIEKQIEQEVQKEEQQIQKKIDAVREERRQLHIAEVVETSETKISEIQTSTQEITSKTTEAIEFQEIITKLANDLGIECFTYIKSPKDLDNSQQGFSEQMQDLITRIRQDIENEHYGFECCGVYSEFSSYLRSIAYELSLANSQYLQEFKQKQLNALLQAISIKFTSLRAKCELASLETEHSEIENRGKIRRLWDKITGQDAKKKKRQSFLEERIKLVKKVIEINAKGLIQEPTKQFSVEEILADIEIFLSQQTEIPETKDLLEQIKQFKQSIEAIELLGIDPEKVKQIINDKKAKQYPSVKEKDSIDGQDVILDYDIQENDELAELKVSESVTAIERMPKLIENIKRLMNQYLIESEQGNPTRTPKIQDKTQEESREDI